jgi:hypothetical protein
MIFDYVMLYVYGTINLALRRDNGLRYLCYAYVRDSRDSYASYVTVVSAVTTKECNKERRRDKNSRHVHQSCIHKITNVLIKQFFGIRSDRNNI